MLVVGGVAFSMVQWPNTSPYAKESPFRPNDPVQMPPDPPRDAPFKRARSEGALKTAREFVDSAVRRRHVERSYDLVTPALRSGFSRRAWAREDIPVQPFPLDSARYSVRGSFTDHVWLQVALFPDQGHKEVPPAVFDLVLRPFGKGEARKWLVDSWAPAGYLTVPSGPLLAARDKQGRPLPAATVEWKAELSERWLIAPVSAFLLGLIVVTLFALNNWWRDRRAVKRYQATYR